jgi:phosphoglycerate dehydrogenase-like enzyme
MERGKDMFTKLVVTEPVGLLPYGIERLRAIAGEVILYEDVPQSVEEIRLRIEGADAILTGHRGKYTEQALSGNPDLRYIGMCCSLYSKSRRTWIFRTREPTELK